MYRRTIWNFDLHIAMLLLMLGTGILVAQNRVHLGVGILQSYAQLDSLNYVLSAFNSENSWTADKPMHEIHQPGGLTAHLGADFEGVLVDIQYSMRLANTRAKGPISPNAIDTQEILIRYNASTVDLGIGVFLVRKPRFRIAIGQSLDFGNLRISGKRGMTGEVQSQIYNRFINELNFATTSFVHCMISFQDDVGPGIFIRPFFQLGIRQNDYNPLNRAIRPVEGLKDSQFILGRQTNIGLKIGVYLGS